jgi:DUF4097 and DUF4098 domain-containing protein YvlB
MTKLTKTITAFALLVAPAIAQDTIKVPLSDPGRPARVKATVLNGSITVKTYQGNEILVEAQGEGPRKEKVRADGLKRIDTGMGSMNIEQENNVVTISGGVMKPANLVLQVPVNTSLYLRSTNGNKIEVEGVSGEIDANILNGSITLTNVSGSVVAHSLNGKVIVRLDRVSPDKAMSFSTLNGTIDVTLPPDIKADFKLKSDNGEVYTDFEMTLKGNASQPVTERDAKGRTRVKIDRSMVGSVNGGGPLVQFASFNGDIYIRKRK